MMHRFLVIVPFVGLLLAVGCQTSSKTQEVQQLQDEVLKLHDEVMPRMDEVMYLKGRISGQLDSMSKAALPTEAQEGMAIKNSLSEADSLMDDWMTNYNADTLKGMDEATAKAYLNAQKTSIQAVQQKMNSSIGRAKKYLEK
jgi:hypothetical protein